MGTGSGDWAPPHLALAANQDWKGALVGCGSGPSPITSAVAPACTCERTGQLAEALGDHRDLRTWKATLALNAPPNTPRQLRGAFGGTHGRIFDGVVADLGTLRADGSLLAHPVTPASSELSFQFLEPTTPKDKDLHRDARCTLHSSVGVSSAGGGVSCVRGRGILTYDHFIQDKQCGVTRSATGPLLRDHAHNQA